MPYPTKEPRPVKELLELMLKNKRLFSTGLCHWIREMYIWDIINWEEECILQEYVDVHKPREPFKGLINNLIELFYRTNEPYFWRKGKLIPRIYWIKKNIKKLS